MIGKWLSAALNETIQLQKLVHNNTTEGNMKISKDSWHYRFNDFSNDNFSYRFSKGQYTTCSYIRTTIASTFASLFKGFIILCIIATILGVVGSMIAVPVMVFMGMTSIPELPAVTCVTGWVAVSVVLFVILVNQIKEWIQNIEFKTSERVKKEPSVFVQAIIDKHNKFCTRVTAD